MLKFQSSTLSLLTFGILCGVSLPACGGDTTDPVDGLKKPIDKGDETDTDSADTDGADTDGTGTDGTDEPAVCAPEMITDPTTLPEGATECTHFCIPNEQITDFSTDTWRPDDNTWGHPETSLRGEHSTYPSGVLTTTHDAAAGTVNITGDVGEYAGWGLYFGPCTDVSRWQGIQITLSGDMGDTTLQLQVQSNNDYPIEGDRGACAFEDPDAKWSECGNNNASVEPVTDMLTTISIPFTDIVGGTPVDTLETSEVWGLQLQWGGCSDEAPCPINITLDKINFY